MHCNVRLRIAACSVAAALGAGCSSEEGPTLVPVEGIVTLDAKPLESATVSFVADPINPHVTSGVGETDEQGVFTIRHNGRNGLSLGKYKVVINKTSEAKSKTPVPEAFANDPFQQSLMGARKETLPGKYSDPSKVTEVVEVKEGKNAFEFNLKNVVASKK